MASASRVWSTRPQSSTDAPIVSAPSATALSTVRRLASRRRARRAAVRAAPGGAWPWSGICSNDSDTPHALLNEAIPLAHHPIDLLLAQREDQLADRAGAVRQHQHRRGQVRDRAPRLLVPDDAERARDPLPDLGRLVGQ